MLDGPDAPAIPGNSRLMSLLPDPAPVPTAAPVVTLFTRDCQGLSAALRPIKQAAAPLAAFQNDRGFANPDLPGSHPHLLRVQRREPSAVFTSDGVLGLRTQLAISLGADALTGGAADLRAKRQACCRCCSNQGAVTTNCTSAAHRDP